MAKKEFYVDKLIGLESCHYRSMFSSLVKSTDIPWLFALPLIYRFSRTTPPFNSISLGRILLSTSDRTPRSPTDLHLVSYAYALHQNYKQSKVAVSMCIFVKH